ncbi:hypothetical protein D1646_13970 [Pseudoflavonifractor sp. 60]|uniref:OmpA/MotB family protein n=1 Tax=Pseudoflavonifractor sp. 60 TaxID=2304576 RepID=UPI001368985A|nr:flagellar motor protein MotB [Pseudoflavonifractor sp. 60]MCI8914293.1 flagellar motor protein MotB [Lawsonibacter sp.]NBI67891.1 hypothetical protein [Pseudoflavonifractor sp. 60]
MASIKKKSSGGGGGSNWMDTYGDMVTLLLCFFVLLYSMSTIDTEKWKWIVNQLNPSTIEQEQPGPTPSDTSNKGGEELPTTTDMEVAMDELYDFLVNYAQNNPENSVSVSQGDGYVFISFDDTVFFDGNSSYIREEGKVILDSIIPALDKVTPFVDELKVLGHTAQQYAYEPNPIPNDRRLASERATEVTIYLQQNLADLEPGRLVVTSYGQWRPVASNETNESRAKNRRVELIITGRELEDKLQDNVAQYFTMYETATGQPVGGAE